MKKYTALLFIFIMIFNLCCCGKDNSGEVTTKNAPSAEEMTSGINSSTVISDENTIEEKNVNKQMIFFGEQSADTLSGFSPLETVDYSVNLSGEGLSSKKLSHSHGPASGGQPHYTVVSFQKSFDKYGALTLDTLTQEKAVYLTFDCGYEYNDLTNKVLDVLKEKNAPATFFSTLDHVKAEPELIARMIKEGHIVGNHSTTHPSFAEITREKMVEEIETFENYLRENFGYASKYFRFPAGEYNESALELINSMGYMSVFWSVAYDDWDTSKVRGKAYATEKVMDRLHDGAIILLHSVSQDNADALGDIIDKAREQGYVFRALTDYKG